MIASTWNVWEGEGVGLAWDVARELTALLDEAAGVVRSHAAWGTWMMAFRTPLIFDRSAIPTTSPTSSPACYQGFTLRPWVARSDWPFPYHNRPEHLVDEGLVEAMIEDRLDECRQMFGDLDLGLDEAVKRFWGGGFWICQE